MCKSKYTIWFVESTHHMIIVIMCSKVIIPKHKMMIFIVIAKMHYTNKTYRFVS